MVEPFTLPGGQIGVPVLVAQQPPSYRGNYGIDAESAVGVDTKTKVPEGQKLDRTAAWVASAPSGEQLSPAVESSAVLPSLGRSPSNASALSPPPPPVPPIRYKPAFLPKRPARLPTGNLLGSARRIPPRRITPDFKLEVQPSNAEAGSGVPGGSSETGAGAGTGAGTETEGKEGEYSSLANEMYRSGARVDIIDPMRSPADSEPLPNPFEDPPSYVHTPKPELGPVSSGSSAGLARGGGGV